MNENVIVALIADAVKSLLASHALQNYKTYFAAAGLIGLAVYQLTQGQVETAITSIFAAVAALGLRHETAPNTNS